MEGKWLGAGGMGDDERGGCLWVLASVIVWYIWPCVKGRVM